MSAKRFRQRGGFYSSGLVGLGLGVGGGNVVRNGDVVASDRGINFSISTHLFLKNLSESLT